MAKSTYRSGVNLGGWLSQYRAYDHDHFRSFITAGDLRRIAAWGMDHVRVPIDYPILEEDAQPGLYKDSGWVYLDQCLEWCQSSGLQLILDLHHAPGYRFDQLDKSSLFQQPALQSRFVNLWRAIARHYRGTDDTLIFELLNEVVLPASEPWNNLMAQTVVAIRGIDPQRQIIVGGNDYNAAAELANLRVLDDANLVYTFHFYIPLVFTHQKAPWAPETFTYDTTVDYPGDCPGLADFVTRYPQYRRRLQDAGDAKIDRALLAAALQPALDFVQRTGRPVYCGEYGVIDRAPLPGRLRWHRDFVDLLKEFDIGRACWTYKAMDFGLVDQDGCIASEELIKIVSDR